METINTLILLTGSQLKLETIHTAIVPEVVAFAEGSPVVLENDQHEYLGTAEITDVKVETFALLQRSHLELVSHVGMTTWPNALAVLAEQVEGFSQLDKVSVVTFFVHAVADTGLTIGAAVEATPAVESAPDTPPTEEEQYAALDEPFDIEGNHA